MGLPGEKDRVQPLSWKSTQHPTHHHHPRPTQGQDRRGFTEGKEVSCRFQMSPCSPTWLQSHSSQKGPQADLMPGALLIPSPNWPAMWGT